MGKGKKIQIRLEREAKVRKNTLLREFIYKTIKKNLTEQSQSEINDCHKWYTNDNSSYVSFMSDCCEGAEGCITVGSQTCGAWSAIANAEGVADACQCCSIDTSIWTTGGEGCEDPLWQGMPTVNQVDYCSRCAEYSQPPGNPQAGTYPVILSAAAPYFTSDANGTSYCHCCVPEGCESPTIAPGDPDYFECIKCFSAQPAAYVAGAAITGPHCSCCYPDDDRTGDRCDPGDGVYLPGDPNHNEFWGMGCWFCHPTSAPGQGCMMVQVPMDQGQAYQGLLAGTTGLYTTALSCENDPITHCGEGTQGNEVQCQCCDNGSPVSMQQTVPSIPGCSVLNGGNLSGCSLHPQSGGTIKDPCKKPFPPIPTGTIHAKTKPDSGDIKKAIREMLKNRR